MILAFFSVSILAQPGQRRFEPDSSGSSFEDLCEFEDLAVKTPEQIEACVQLETAETVARELILRELILRELMQEELMLRELMPREHQRRSKRAHLTRISH